MIFNVHSQKFWFHVSQTLHFFLWVDFYKPWNFLLTPFLVKRGAGEGGITPMYVCKSLLFAKSLPVSVASFRVFPRQGFLSPFIALSLFLSVYSVRLVCHAWNHFETLTADDTSKAPFVRTPLLTAITGVCENKPLKTIYWSIRTVGQNVSSWNKLSGSVIPHRLASFNAGQ